MAAPWLLPLLAGLTGLAFALTVAFQFRSRRRPHQLAWALGLAAYAGASFIEAWVGGSGWSVPLYRVYLPLAGANVGLLGLGTLFLIAPRASWRWLASAAATLVVVLAVGQFAVDVAPALSGVGVGIGAKPLPFTQPARLAFLALNVLGGLSLIGGALWSWWRTRSHGVLLIGVGAMLPFSGGSLSTIAGLDARVVFQFLGIVVMFLGYLRSREGAPPRTAPAPSAPTRG